MSEYSKENILLAKELCQNKESVAVFWENEELKESQNNYFDILENIPEDISDNFFIVSEGKYSDNFILIISEFILKNNIDIVITKGRTSDVWPISLVKKYFGINNIPFLVVLDRLVSFNDFDKSTLEPFDYIFGMGPSCLKDIFIEKTEILFKKEMFFYRNIESDCKDSNIMVLCNKNNIKKLSEHPRLKSDYISFVDVESCPDEELCILLSLSKIIIDESYFNETNLILSKLGRKYICLEEFFEGNYEHFLEQSKEYLFDHDVKKVFFEFIKKEIQNRLQKKTYNPIVEGSEIGIGD